MIFVCLCVKVKLSEIELLLDYITEDVCVCVCVDR